MACMPGSVGNAFSAAHSLTALRDFPRALSAAENRRVEHRTQFLHAVSLSSRS